MENETYKLGSNNGDTWCVFLGYINSEGTFIKKDVVFTGSLISCYTWIKAKNENLIID